MKVTLSSKRASDLERALELTLRPVLEQMRGNRYHFVQAYDAYLTPNG